VADRHHEAQRTASGGQSRMSSRPGLRCTGTMRSGGGLAPGRKSTLPFASASGSPLGVRPSQRKAGDKVQRGREVHRGARGEGEPLAANHWMVTSRTVSPLMPHWLWQPRP
jgi:hypothetical protein